MTDAEMIGHLWTHRTQDHPVFSDEKLVGELTISAAQEDRSRASYSGDLTVLQGWTVKAK